MVVGIINTANGTSRFCIPPPRSVNKFIIYPSLWKLPNLTKLSSVIQRIKTNLLFFQTNYLILTLAIFAIFIILSMRTLLTGVLTSVLLVVALLFFFEHIPQAREIKQNHPTIVIIAGIGLIIVAWHALTTILYIVAAFLAPIPLWVIHAAMRSSDHILDGTDLKPDSFTKTPVGHIMQILGMDPLASNTES